MMMTRRLLGLGLALFAIGCSPPAGPDNPSFEKDIKPIMLAHCVRCHGAGGKLNADPDSIGGTYRNKPPLNLYLDSFDDPACPAGVSCLGAKRGSGTFSAYLPGEGDDRMPPKPAEALSDLQLEIVLRWASKSPNVTP
jgi:hypothetical protein